MPARLSIAVLCGVTLAVLSALPGAGATAAETSGAAAGEVRELAYGEILFHYFQGDYLTALTRLLAAEARGELKVHAADGELLLGALHLSYGQHRRAGEIFQRLLAESVDPDTHDRAWFFLAKIWYQRGYLAEADAALARIGGALPPELEAERVMLSAQVLMAQQRFADALSLLEAEASRGDARAAFARYNIGVALIRLDRVDEGVRVLEAVGLIETDDPEVAALRDRANVALGYAWLQSGRPESAIPPLERVRLTGPFANRALLGVGWAAAEQERYSAALSPWLALRSRPLTDTAAQEALLAVPYAYASLGANRDAADYYLDATGRYSAEIERIDRTIADIRNGELLDALLADSARGGEGWYWQLDAIPSGDQGRYLYELIATHEFRESVKSYRDLSALRSNLSDWARSLDAFDDILDTRQRAWQQRMPGVDAGLGRSALDEMSSRRVRLTASLDEVERTEDYAALGTSAQQALWSEFDAVEGKLALLGDGGRAAELRDRHRFLRGLLQWDLERSFKARLWQQRRDLRDLERLLSDARQRHQRVARARDGWPEQFAALTERIGRLDPRVARLMSRTETALTRQRTHIESMAIDELSARRGRIETYRLQASFALARLYDRAASADRGAAGPGAAR